MELAERWEETLVFKRLRSIPGVGWVVASTLVAAKWLQLPWPANS